MAYIRRNSGLIVPSDEAISGGLSFAMAFQNGPRSAFMTRGAVATQDYAGSKPGLLRAGVACVGPGNPLGWGGTSTANTYSVSTTSGTMLVYVVADHASNATTHNRNAVLLGDTTGYPNSPSVSIQNSAGGQWYCGWISSGENRIVTSAASSYASGDDFTVAVTWNTSFGQRLYVKGVQLSTNGWTTYASTAGSQVNVNGLDGAVWPWADSDNGGVLYVVVYDRELSAQEIAAAEADPWWWSDRSRRPVWKAEAATSIAGTLSATLAAATLASTATVAIAGTSSATLAAATLSATGTLAISSTASATLAATTVVAAGTVALTGSTTATLAAATLAGTGTISLSATLTSTLDDATLAATGTAGTVVTGTLAVTLDAATLAAASTLALRGTTTTTLANATLAGTGTLSLRATSSVTLGNVTLSATGTNGNVVNAIVLVWNGVRI